jgi:hypothetical protein
MREDRSAKLARILAYFLAGLLTTSFGSAQEKRNSECAEDLSADTGQPVMFQHGPLTWGLSTRPIMYGQKLLVLLWIHNPTDKPLSVATCGNIDYFWAYEIEVLDSAGKHVPSLAEEKRKRDGNLHEIWGCTGNIIFSVPPHVCLHGTFSKPESDFARDLNEYYSLPPGRYSLAPTETGDDSTRIPRTGKDRKVHLSISVTTP